MPVEPVQNSSEKAVQLEREASVNTRGRRTKIDIAAQIIGFRENLLGTRQTQGDCHLPQLIEKSFNGPNNLVFNSDFRNTAGYSGDKMGSPRPNKYFFAREVNDCDLRERMQSRSKRDWEEHRNGGSRA
jgi:hypothetical protein